MNCIIKACYRNSFWNCRNLKKIVIPRSVRQIGYNPFGSCVNLIFENHSENYALENDMLFDQGKNELICCTGKAAENGVKIPTSVVNIGRNSFTGCESLKEIEIPNNVKYIGRGAFSGCINLERVILAKGIKSIGDWVFNNCLKLNYIEVPSHVEIPQNVFNNCSPKIVRF